jgi:hypothetical protein
MTTTTKSKTAPATQRRPLNAAEAFTSRPREAIAHDSAGAGEGSNEGSNEGEGTADSHASGEGKAVTEGKARRRFKEVWMVEDRPEAKSIWTRVGTAFENQDGSWNIRLSALPVGSGRLNMRDPIDRSTHGDRGVRAANSDRVEAKAEQVAA